MKSINKKEVLLNANIAPNLFKGAYQLSEDWKAIDRLRDIRNSKFAHIKSCKIKSSELEKIVETVSESYSILAITEDRIKHILTGTIRWHE